MDEKLLLDLCRRTSTAYFGDQFYVLQNEVRHRYMDFMIREETARLSANSHLRMIEIGSWGGCSATTWAEAIKKYHRGNGTVICVDSWEPYGVPEGNVTQLDYSEGNSWLEKGLIFELFLHNIKSSGNHQIVHPLKGASEKMLPLLAPSSFNLIYIDGNHDYEHATTDIHNAAKLIVDGGIMCGDDLELQIDQIDVENAKKNKDKDFIMDPIAKTNFHPGVALAVGEFFGSVSENCGFWAMRKVGAAWEKVSLPQLDEVSIPPHLEGSRSAVVKKIIQALG